MNYPSNTNDLIDSRDVIEAIEELAGDAQYVCDVCGTAGNTDDGISGDGDECPDENCSGHVHYAATETDLLALQALAKQGEDWQYGSTLIRDSYFETYAQDLADEIGDMDTDQASRWPFTCIDWEWAARELRYDYTSVDFDGVTYWVR